MLKAFVSLLMLCAVVSAATPRVGRVTPPGGQRGTSVEIDFIGNSLDDPRELLFYETGIKLDKIEMLTTVTGPNGKPGPVDSGTRVRAKISIAADCPLGAHGFRLVTANGLSEYRQIFVGPFPTLEENESANNNLKKNDTRGTAIDVPLNTSVFGRINEATDIDWYKIEVKKGQRVSAEVESARLGTDRGIPDLHLMITDADGRKLAAADDSALFMQDPVLSILAEKDGAYYIEVRHSMYNGTGEQYRLHLGTFSRPTGLYPAGGPAGGELSVTILGDPNGLRKEIVKLPTKPGDYDYASVVDSLSAPTPNKLRVSPFANVLEAEPNDNADSLNSAITTLPVAFNGIISKPGDVDCFPFKARKGEQFKFHCLANSFGSPMDPVIWIKAANGKGKATLARATESRTNQLGMQPGGGLNRDTHDAILEFTAPADGDYILGVEDERGEGTSEHVYRVEVTPEENAIYTYIAAEPENQQVPQARQAITVGSGNRATAQIAIFATNKPSPVELELVGVNLPSGVTLHAPKLAPGMTKVPVVFAVAPGTKPSTALIDLIVKPVNGKPVESGYRQSILMNGYGNNDYYLHVPIHKLALAVIESAPFAVTVEEPKSALVQNGEVTVKFTVKRFGDFDGPVTVQMDYKPLGLSTATPVTIPPGKTEGVYLIGAARNAGAGKHQLAMTGISGNSGRRVRRDGEAGVYVASQPFTLTIAEPHVEAKIPRSSIERGKTATLTCKLNQLQAFEGKAVATLARLPRGVELVETTREITAKDSEVIFTLRATNDALVGNYQGIVLDVTVQDHGQAVRQLSGSGILRIDAERGAPAKK